MKGMPDPSGAKWRFWQTSVAHFYGLKTGFALPWLAVFCGILTSCGERAPDAPTMPLAVILPSNYQWLAAEQVTDLRNRTPNLGILDVRDDVEMRDGHGWIGGAQPCSYFAGVKDKLAVLDRERPWLVYCAMGGRSELMAKDMADLGFKQVYLLKGGFIEWRAKKMPVVK